MTCLRNRDKWHSYVSQNLSEVELQKMTAHLEHCDKCQGIVASITETSAFLSRNRVILDPPKEIKINVMLAIDKYKYKKEPVSHQFTLNRRHLGVSMVAAGLILLAINLIPSARNFSSGQLAELNFQLGQQIALPFTHLSQALNASLEKIPKLNNTEARNND